MPRTIDHYGSLKLPKNATKQQIKAKFYEVRGASSPAITPRRLSHD
jgi:hypothetical protein